MNNLGEFNEKYLNDIFHNEVRPMLFNNRKPVARGERPVFIQLGGQLAAGKSRAIKDIASRHGANVVILKPDDLREFHENYREIMRIRPHDMANLTSGVMKRLTNMVCDYAHKEGYNLAVEGAFKTPQKLVGRAARMAKASEKELDDGSIKKVHDGYINEVIAIATPHWRSSLDMVIRYVNDPPGEGRWSEIEGHDKSFAQIPRSLEALEESPHVNRVIITDRSGIIYYDNNRNLDGAWSQKPQGAEILREQRRKSQLPPGESETREWLEQYQDVFKKLIRRDEVNAYTASTMMALHRQADRVYHASHKGKKEAIAKNEKFQGMAMLAIIEGVRKGAGNQLPPKGGRYINSNKEEHRKPTGAPETTRPKEKELHEPPEIKTGLAKLKQAARGKSYPGKEPNEGINKGFQR